MLTTHKVFLGVTEGIRTLNLRDHNPALYQLSYSHHGGLAGSRAGAGCGRKHPVPARCRAFADRSAWPAAANSTCADGTRTPFSAQVALRTRGGIRTPSTLLVGQPLFH